MTEARDANPFAQPAEWARADKLESELATLRAEHDRLRADYASLRASFTDRLVAAQEAAKSVQALRQALEWSLRYLDMLTFEAGGAYYAQAGRMELAGFGAALEKAKAALALPGEKETK